MTGHQVQWVTASPLWPDVVPAGDPTGGDRVRMRRPALLRFAAETFMEDLSATLDADPRRVAGLVAVRESARRRPPGVAADWQPELDDLRLYQAAHGRFYLVAATLTCRVPGLPEHCADPTRQESVSFVLRRLQAGGEWAWAADPATGRKGWTPAPSAAAAVAPGEELLPMHPVNYAREGRRRRLYVGLVPTSSRETFAAAGPLSPLPGPPAAGEPKVDARREAFRARVVEPWDALPPRPPDGDAAAEVVLETRREVTLFALLDAADLVRTCVPEAWAALGGGKAAEGSAGALVSTLTTAHVGTGVTWAQALQAAWQQRLQIAGESDDEPTLRLDLGGSTLTSAALQEAFRRALPPLSSSAGAAGAAAVSPAAPTDVPKLDAAGDARYVLRCVYRRPLCPPSLRDVVSDPSERFTIAPFFDLDAPSRTVTVSLPLSTRIRDLRRYPHGVTFLFSDELSRSMSRVSSLKGALDGKAEAGRPLGLGMVCSFSIPIITMVALLLLMLIVTLLNFVFGWLPYLRVCLPVPFKAQR